jgi:hypothetical protein
MWRVIQFVTTPITLIAFVIAVSAWLYRIKISSARKLVETANPKDRAELVLATLETYHIRNDNLTPDQKFDLMKKVIQVRANQSRLIALVAVVVAVLTAIVLAAALLAHGARKEAGTNDGAELRHQGELRDKILSELNEVDETKRNLAAIKVASYGEDALPAIKMALGSDEDVLRNGAVLGLKQMYVSQTVDREKLFDKVLSYYDDGNSDLCRGVLEWMVTMAEQLPLQERTRVFSRLKLTFRSQAEDCAKRDDQVALQAARFLFFSPFENSKEFVMGMVSSCKGDGAREAAVNALPRICASLKKSDRDGVASFLESEILPRASEGLKARIEAAITRIHSLQEP